MKLTTKDLILCAVFASVTSVLAQISIPLPFTAIPLTMQVFAVALSGVVLGSKKGFISQLIYILMGAIGVPVFAQMRGGISVVLGPTGGFLLVFPIMALIIGYFSEKFKKPIYIMFGMIIGLTLDYLGGTLIFMIITKSSFIQGIMACVVPFIVLDLVKIAMATVIGVSVKQRVKIGAKSC